MCCSFCNVTDLRIRKGSPSYAKSAEPIRIPNTWAGASFYFEKVADKKTRDFPLVNVAAAMRVSNGAIEDIRIVAGGIDCVSRRMTVVEDIVKGSAQDDAQQFEGCRHLSRHRAARYVVRMNLY
jgi:CO/xanthine dehydrogenase FAD-binding subunit